MYGITSPLNFRILLATALVFLFACSAAVCQTPLSQGEHNVVLNGVRLWYKVAGNARPGQAPILYLHGGPGYNSYSFERTIGARLEAHALVIYLDERGSGRSERPWDRNYEMATLIADVEALRDSLGAPKLIPMGHSFGGTIALEYSARYPQRVQKLVVIDGAADMPASLGLWQAAIKQRYPSAWESAMAGEKGRALEVAMKGTDPCTIDKAAFAVDMAALSNVDSAAFHQWQQFRDQRFRIQQEEMDAASGLRNTGELSAAYFKADASFLCYRFSAYDKLTMPVLVMVGKYDGAVGVETMRALADHVPHAQFDEFERSAHFPYAEEPDKFEHDVTMFLSK